MKVFAFLAVICLFSSTISAGQNSDGHDVEGTVRDPTGALVSGAKVILAAANFGEEQSTDQQGHFAFRDVPVSRATIKVLVAGFAAAERNWEANDQGPATLEIVLTPAHLTERIAVTANLTRQRVSDTAESTTVLTHEDLSSAAASTLDAALRQVPGFVLFRRTGSLTSNPTSQGVSLRGAGSSGEAAPSSSMTACRSMIRLVVGSIGTGSQKNRSRRWRLFRGGCRIFTARVPWEVS